MSAMAIFDGKQCPEANVLHQYGALGVVSLSAQFDGTRRWSLVRVNISWRRKCLATCARSLAVTSPHQNVITTSFSSSPPVHSVTALQ